MTPEDRTIPCPGQEATEVRSSDIERRRVLVREVVAGAILPGLLAKKDAGVFERGPNVVRLTEGRWTD